MKLSPRINRRVFIRREGQEHICPHCGCWMQKNAYGAYQCSNANNHTSETAVITIKEQPLPPTPTPSEYPPGYTQR